MEVEKVKVIVVQNILLLEVLGVYLLPLGSPIFLRVRFSSPSVGAMRMVNLTKMMEILSLKLDLILEDSEDLEACSLSPFDLEAS